MKKILGWFSGLFYSLKYDKVDAPASYIFANALSHLLEHGEGIVVPVQGEGKRFTSEADRVIVYRDGAEIKIMLMDKDNEGTEGQLVWVHNEVGGLGSLS